LFDRAPFAFSRASGFYAEEHMNLTPDLEIVYLDPHDLTPYEGNARKHGDVDLQGIKDSIETDGFNDPIGIWGDNNLIVEGHGRQLAAIELGMEKVPCIRLDHLTDAQRRDYAIRHNRTAELSEWDEAKKQIELEALAMEGFDVGELFEPQGEQKQASTEKSVAMHDTFQVIVDCADEDETEEVYNKLTAEGYECRISTL
jgi:hypothetical protein